MKAVAFFGGACFLIFVAAGAVSVYGFGQFEHAWGRGGSFQIETWLSLVGAIIAMGVFGISAAMLRRVPEPGISLMLGAACGVAFIAVCWGINSIAPSVGVFVALILLVGLSIAASFATDAG